MELPIELLFSILHDLMPSRSDLLHAALVCKAWREPALDILWANMDRLVPLFSLYAPVKCTKRDGIELYDWRHKPTLSLLAWTTFHSYARRVKSFTPHDDSTHEAAYFTDYSNDLFDLLKTAATMFGTPNAALFPSLQRLEWRCGRASMTEQLPYLLAPGNALKKLHVDVVHVVRPEQGRRLMDKLREALESFAWKMSPFTSNDDLLALPMSECLSAVQPQCLSFGKGFWGIGWLNVVLPCLSTNLQELQFSARFRGDDDITARLDLLSENHPNLERLALTILSTRPLRWASLAAVLYRLQQLRSLSLNSYAGCVVSNGDVESVAVAWPAIRELRLFPEVSYHSDKTIYPVSCIIAYATHFPNLEVLGLPLETNDLSLHTPLPTPIWKLRKLETNRDLFGEGFNKSQLLELCLSMMSEGVEIELYVQLDDDPSPISRDLDPKRFRGFEALWQAPRAFWKELCEARNNLSRR